MKTKIILFVIFICAMNISQSYAQDIINPPKLNINFNDLSVIDRNYNHFVKGTNWHSAGRQLDSALGLNSWHFGDPSITMGMVKNNHRLLHKVDGLTYGITSYHDLQAMSIMYEPSLLIDTTDNFKPKLMDTVGSVFGFLYKYHSFIEDSTSYPDINYHRFILRKDSIQGPNSVLVLGNTWPKNQLYYNKCGSFDRDGTNWYLTINLRNLGIIDTLDNTPVITIKLPYTSKGLLGTRYIEFDSIPDTNSISTIHGIRGDYRGLTRLPATNNNPDKTVFVITRKMLSTNQTADTNITLSAHFNATDDQYTLQPNNRLRCIYPGEDTDTSKHFITDIDIEVYYHGHVDCAIDMIKLETKYSREYFGGDYDNTIRDKVQNTLNMITPNDRLRGVRLHRFYVADEFKLPHWGAIHYFNKLVDGLAISETELVYPAHFIHCLEFSKIWTGETQGLTDWQAVPFIKNSTRDGIHADDYMAFGYHFGYKGINFLDSGTTARHLKDTINSLYETFIMDANAPPNTDKYVPFPLDTNLDIYNTRYSSESGVQIQYEKNIFQNYFNRTSKLLFSGIPWYANVWIAADNWNAFEATSSSFSRITGSGWNRIKTGEECRLMSNISLIAGSKGLMYWTNKDVFQTTTTPGLFTYAFGTTSIGNNTLQSIINADTTLRNSKKLLYSDKIGGDFITFPDPSGCTAYFDSRAYRWDSLGHDSTRIFLGRASQRAEIYKQCKYLDFVGDTLLNLRLTSLYSRGYRTHQKTHPAFPSDIFNRFIRLDSITTQKINRLNNGNPIFDTTGMQFFDMSLLRNVADSQMQKSVYWGLLNRRTDPLIHDLFLNTGYMTFITTAEFDKFVHENGHMGHDSTYWQSKYWSKQGAREFVCPLQFPKSSDSLIPIIHVHELGSEYDLLNREDWRDKKYYHMIDTLLGGFDTLKIRLMPGDMKILQADYLYNHVISGGDSLHPCNICSSINNMNVIVEPVYTDPTYCCWEVKLQYNDGCSYLDVQVSLAINNADTVPTFLPPYDEGLSCHISNYGTHDMAVLTNIDTLSPGLRTIGLFCSKKCNTFDFSFHIYGASVSQSCVKDTSLSLSCLDSTSCCSSMYLFSENHIVYYEPPVPPTTVYDLYLNQNDTGCCKAYGLRVQKDNGIYYVDIPPDPNFVLHNIYLYSKERQYPYLCDPPDTVIYTIEILGLDSVVICNKIDTVICMTVSRNDSLAGGIHNAGNPNPVFDQKNNTDIIKSFYCVPNPTDNETKIYYQLGQNSKIEIILLDNLGNKISQIFEGNASLNLNFISFKTENLASGMYNLVLRSDYGTKRISLVIVK